MKYLLSILCLFILSCDGDGFGCGDESACNYDPNAIFGGYCIYEEDQCGECGGDDYTNEGYYCGDIQVLQDFIDANPSLYGLNPLDLSYYEWDDNGRLIHLNLNGYDLSSQNPESIGNLTSLTYLSLAYNDQMHGSIPDAIGNLVNLVTLYLNNNQFTSLPSTIENLINLETLSVGGNNLTSLPESLCNIPGDCEIRVYSNLLCNEYNYTCIDWFDTQDQSNCCEGINNEGETDPNWTTCP